MKLKIRKLNTSLKYSHLHNKKQRKLKINEINNYVRQFNINYSSFINNLHINNFRLDKKIINNICLSETKTIKSLLKILN